MKSSNSKIEPAGHKSVDFIIGLLGRISDEYEEIHMLIVSIQIVPYKGNKCSCEVTHQNLFIYYE